MSRTSSWYVDGETQFQTLACYQTHHIQPEHKGLPADASSSDVVTRYRSLMARWHPDKYGAAHAAGSNGTALSVEHAGQLCRMLNQAFRKLNPK